MRHLAALVATGLALVSTPARAAPAMESPYRLTMKVTVSETGDSKEGPGNTEDEIYFALAGLTKIKGIETVKIRRTVRPQISRDFWEMGSLSADDFRATIFEGSLGGADTAAFGVLVGEQDNQSAASLIAIFTLALTGLIERMTTDLLTDDETSRLTIAGLGSEVDKLGNQMMSSGDELMGAVEVLVRGGNLVVRTPANTSSTLLASTTKTAAVRISGGGGIYRLDFTLEDTSAARPLTQTFLSREHDQCGQPNLFVEKRGGGTVSVRKGDRDVAVHVKDDVFHWHCGSMSEDDETNAPDDTRYVEVTRASSGGRIEWDTYHEAEATPQYAW